MSDQLLSILDCVARSIESVVPGLALTPEVGEPVWVGDDELEIARGQWDRSASGGEWLTGLGFELRYWARWLGSFEHMTSGSERERVLSVTIQLMSEVQDLVSEATTEPWPLILVNGRRHMAEVGAAIEGDDLHMWYGDRDAPALTLPSVRLA